MGPDKRNAKIVASLIASMTIGATALLWLEPPMPGWSSTTLLMAESARGVEEVQIDYISAPADRGFFDCVIAPDGNCHWAPRSSTVRLAVVASDAQALPQPQAETLLAVFGTMAQRHGLDLARVWLHPASDARLHPELSDQAHDLCELLLRKGIVR